MDNYGTAVGGEARAGKFSERDLGVQRRNLLGVCRMCIKSIVDLAAFEVIGDDCVHVDNFCNVMEHIFTHQIQVRWSLFGSSEAPAFWYMICRLFPGVSVTSVNDMEEIQTDLGRGRAWIRLALVQKKLASCVNSLLSKSDAWRSMYMPGAFLCSSEMPELAGTLICLDAIDFNLCLRGEDFDYPEREEIDFSPYLRFRQCAHSIADDSREEHKLSTPLSERPRQLGRAVFHSEGGEEEEEDDEEEEGGRGDREATQREENESVVQLREMLKTEREQKNYFEELVSVRDAQLAKIQSELVGVASDGERQRQELERVVLELQQQVEQQHSELRRAHRRKEESRQRGHSEPHPQDGHSGADGSQKRTGTFSLFSGLFGD